MNGSLGSICLLTGCIVFLHLDQEHRIARDALCQRIWCRSRIPDRRQHCFVRLRFPPLRRSRFCLTCDPQRTHRQTVLGRTDVHDNAATGDSPLRRHHSQPRHHCRHHHCYLVGCVVRHTAPSVIVAWLSLLHRLRRSYPDFLNTSGLLVDVVSVMGNILHYLIQCVKE